MTTTLKAGQNDWFLHGGGETGELLRQFNWTAHPMGPPHQWPAIIQATISIVLGSRQPMFLICGAEHHILYNDRYAEICGQRHPMALGAPMSAVWYDIWDVIGDLVARVHAGESIHMDDIQFLMHRNGYPEETHFSFSYSPLRDQNGDIIGIFCACAETTEQVLLRRQLEHERATLASLFDQSHSFIAKLAGPDHVFEIANPSLVRLVGRQDLVGHPLREVLPEVLSQGYQDVLNSVRASGQTSRVESARVMLQRTIDGPPEERFVDMVYQPSRNTTGEVTGVFVEGVDVTARVQAMKSLEASEQFLRSILRATPDCIKVLNLEGQIEFISDRGRALLQFPDDYKVEGACWINRWEEETRETVARSVALANTGEASGFQAYGKTFAGNLRYWDVRVTPMLDGEGRPERILAVSRDVTYLKSIETEREHLVNELSHRLKNAFSMVQSVINQSLRRASSLEDARAILSGRVRALSDAQNILTRSITDSMDIREVVEAALMPHRTGDGRFAVSGPDVTISGKQGLGLSLALHELCTNATKYGALSDNIGRVEVGWRVGNEGDFEFFWKELDGPKVNDPEPSGFGTVLIKNIVATYFDGSASLEFLRDGIIFRLVGMIVPHDGEAPDPY